jgi:hypothetical protein
VSFTRDWNEASPANTDIASGAPTDMKNIKGDLSDRLKAMFYGFIAGENTYDPHSKQITLRTQASIALPPVLSLTLAAKTVDGKAELFWQDEDGNERQITTKGLLNLLGTDGVAVLTGAQTIAGVKTFSDVPVLPANVALTTPTLTSPVLNTGVSGTAVLDEDSMASNSDTKLATQQSIKAYVDTTITAALVNALGVRVTVDSLGNAFSTGSVYKAGSAGRVSWRDTINSGVVVYGYVGSTSSPTLQTDVCENQGLSSIIDGRGYLVAKDEYWKITKSAGSVTAIYWQPFGTGTCVKQP